jgi:hypothetical protein
MKVFWFILFVCRSLFAADLITTMESSTAGSVISATDLINSSVGIGDGYWHAQSTNNAFNYTLIAGTNQAFGGRTFKIGSAFFDGSGTRSMAHDFLDPRGWGECAILHLPTMPNFGKKVSWGVMVYYDLSTTNSSQITYDHLNTGTIYAQLNVNKDTGLYYDAEQTATGTSFGSGFNITNRHWYLMTGLIDFPNGTAKVQYLDPSNGFSTMGESVVTFTGFTINDQSFNTHDFYLGDPYTTHIGYSQGYALFENFVVDWTTATYPLLPTYTIVLNGAVLNGFHTQ